LSSDSVAVACGRVEPRKDDSMTTDQKPGRDGDRKGNPAKQAPGPGQAGREMNPDRNDHDRRDPSRKSPETEPQDPGDLGRDPRPDNIQAKR
jgi:hypothetical protein